MKEGCIISEFNQCGLFLCQKGQAEILLGGRPYQINKRNLFIYTAANLLQIRQRSADLEGIMIEVDLDYVIPIVNKVANSENLLYLRENPCLSLSEEQYTFVENLLKSVEKRINRENICNSSRQVRKLIDLDYRIDTEFFKLTLVGGQRERFLSRSELGEMQIICPPDADFSDENLQAWLRKVIEEALRRNAKIILPPRLYMLSMHPQHLRGIK